MGVGRGGVVYHHAIAPPRRYANKGSTHSASPSRKTAPKGGGHGFYFVSAPLRHSLSQYYIKKGMSLAWDVLRTTVVDFGILSHTLTTLLAYDIPFACAPCTFPSGVGVWGKRGKRAFDY